MHDITGGDNYQILMSYDNPFSKDGWREFYRIFDLVEILQGEFSLEVHKISIQLDDVTKTKRQIRRNHGAASLSVGAFQNFLMETLFDYHRDLYAWEPEEEPGLCLW